MAASSTSPLLLQDTEGADISGASPLPFLEMEYETERLEHLSPKCSHQHTPLLLLFLMLFTHLMPHSPSLSFLHTYLLVPQM